MSGQLKKYRVFRSLSIGGVHSLLAYAASLLLTGVPPEVCESTINEVVCSVKRSLSALMP